MCFQLSFCKRLNSLSQLMQKTIFMPQCYYCSSIEGLTMRKQASGFFQFFLCVAGKPLL